MRILLLNNSHLPQIGGKEIVVHHLASQFTQLGHSVHLGGLSGYREFRHYDFGYPIDRTPSIPGLNQGQQSAIRATIALLRRSYDVIHAHTTHPSAYAAAKAKQRLRVKTPLVVTPHGADIHKVPELNFGKRLKPELDQKIRWVLSRCDKATAISESVRHSLLDAGSPADSIVDIPNGVDVDRFERVSALNAREHLNIPQTSRLLVSTGNYHPRKGHEVLVRALEQLDDPGTHLAIIGRQNDQFVRDVKAGPVGNRVRFKTIPYPIERHAIDNDLLAAMLQQADIYISASKDEGSEGLSLAVLEAMAAGCCTIVTDISGNRDVVTDHVSGRLVPPNSPSELAQAIQETLQNQEAKKSMASAAQDLVKSMSWRAIANQYLSLYSETIDGNETQSESSCRKQDK